MADSRFATLSNGVTRLGRLAVRSWAAPPGDAALSFSPIGEHTSPRREHPQLGDAKHNPGRYDLWRQSASRLAFAATLIRHRTSEKNCSNNPRNSSCGPSLPSLMIGVAT